MRQLPQNLLSLAILLLFLIGVISVNGAEQHGFLRFDQFKACIRRCTEMAARCNDKVKDKWQDFLAHKKEITKQLRKCCLRNEVRSDARPEDSFAACARITCGAALWGYAF